MSNVLIGVKSIQGAFIQPCSQAFVHLSSEASPDEGLRLSAVILPDQLHGSRHFR